MKIGTAASGANFVWGFDGSAGGFYRGLGFIDGGNWVVTVGDGEWNTGVAAPVDGDWHHVAVVYSSGNVQFYFDGTGTSRDLPGSFGGGSQSLTIGYDGYDSGSQYFSGAIDEVDVWKSALASGDITQLYNGGSGLQGDYPVATNLVAGFHFDENTGTTAHDFTGSGHDGTLSVGAGWTTSSKAALKIASYGPYDTTGALTPSGAHVVKSCRVYRRHDLRRRHHGPDRNRAERHDNHANLSRFHFGPRQGRDTDCAASTASVRARPREASNSLMQRK